MSCLTFAFRECTEEDARKICTWRYEGEYSIYDFSPWEVVCANGWDLSVPETRSENYISVLLDGELFGFYNIQVSDENVEIGVGMRPDMCGKHFGVEFMKPAMRIANERYPLCHIIVKVRTFNKRAVKCYKNCGFEIASKYYDDKAITPGEMYVMKLRLE